MPISRLFTAAGDATAATDELKAAGFNDDIIHVVSNSPAPVTVAAIEKLGVSRKRAPHYATRINGGAVLVMMDPPFGTGAIATDILERHGPAEGDDAPVEAHHAGSDHAAPFSAALRLRVLSHDRTPLSTLLRLPTLSRDETARPSSFGLPLLWKKAAPLSAAAGVPVLSAQAAPLSSAAKVKVLWGDAAPLSAAIGMKVLSDDPAPLSRLLGWKLLTKEAAPLSKQLHAPVLANESLPVKDPAPSSTASAQAPAQAPLHEPPLHVASPDPS